MDRINANGGGGWQQGHGQQNCSVDVDEHTADEEHDVGEHQEAKGGENMRGNEDLDGLGDVDRRNHTSGAVGEANQDADGSDADSSVYGHLQKARVHIVLVHEVLDEVEDDAVEHDGNAGLGSGEDTSINVAEDDDWHEQSGNGVTNRNLAEHRKTDEEQQEDPYGCTFPNILRFGIKMDYFLFMIGYLSGKKKRARICSACPLPLVIQF